MVNFVGSGTPLSQGGVDAFGATTATGADEMWSVLAVETSGCGFLPNRRPKILFERHVFHALTGGIYDVSNPDISQSSAGGYGAGGAHQYDRLAEAIGLDQDNALKSASWGLGQIMGTNFSSAGYADIETMVTAMVAGEDDQLEAMANFLVKNKLAAKLAAHDWAGLAQGYNGPDYAANNYDGKLQHFYSIYAGGARPDITVRQAQLLLTYKNFNPGGVDGIMGPNTANAIKQFQAQAGLPQTGQPDPATIAALSA